jgi:hypothetical protein
MTILWNQSQCRDILMGWLMCAIHIESDTVMRDAVRENGEKRICQWATGFLEN